MDNISLLDAIVMYSLLFSPPLTITLLLFWASAEMKNTVKAQLLGIVILFILGLLAINSPIILIIETTAILLFVVWFYTYRNFFRKEQLTVFSHIFVLQFSYYLFFFVILILEYHLAIILLCLIPIYSMKLFYSWTFVSKYTSIGRVFIILVFIAQVIFTILNIMLYLITTSIL